MNFFYFSKNQSIVIRILEPYKTAFQEFIVNQFIGEKNVPIIKLSKLYNADKSRAKKRKSWAVRFRKSLRLSFFQRLLCVDDTEGWLLGIRFGVFGNTDASRNQKRDFSLSPAIFRPLKTRESGRQNYSM